MIKFIEAELKLDDSDDSGDSNESSCSSCL